MCGRYTTIASPGELSARFGVELADDRGTGRYNVAPTEDILAVVADSPAPPGGPAARVLRWGLRSSRPGARLINARCETASAKPPFRALARTAAGRCLVVADGFYEWLRPEDPRQPRQPFRFTVDGGVPFAFAGLCDEEAATIVTTPANDLVGRIHDRMPAILSSPDAEAAWLSPALGTRDALELCRPLAPERMAVAAVSRRVNKAGIPEGPELLVPEDAAPLAARATLF